MINSLSKCKYFFFAPVQLRPVRIFSILTTCLVVINFKYWEPHSIDLHLFGFQLWQFYGSTYVYQGILVVLTFVFILGLRPRVTGLVLVAMLFPLVFEGATSQSRQILLFSLFCLVLLNGGKSLRDLPIWPIRLIQVQLCVVYGINALAKFHPEYLSGEVLVAMSMTLHNFLTDMSDGLYHIGALAIPAAIAAKASVFVESFLAFGFWHPSLRWVCAAVGIIFHLQLMSIIEIGMLDWVSMFLYLSFLLRFSNDDK